MRQALIAPQLGLWAPIAPATDNPAAKSAPMSAEIRARLVELRNQARERYAAQVRKFPDVWHW